MPSEPHVEKRLLAPDLVRYLLVLASHLEKIDEMDSARRVLDVSHFATGSTSELYGEARMLLPELLERNVDRLSVFERARLRDVIAGIENEFRLESRARMNELARIGQELLRAVGFPDVELLDATYDSLSFGSGRATFQVGQLLVMLICDRGEDFLHVASTKAPTTFHQFDDVEVAMGWRTVEEVLAKTAPEELVNVVGRLFQNYGDLVDAFSGDRERFTRARVEKCNRERGAAFMGKLRF